MVDAIDNNDNKKIKKTKSTTAVDKAKEIDQVKKTGAVDRVSNINPNDMHRATRVMTAAEREKLMQMVKEESEKLFKNANIPAEEQEIIELAVQKTIDSSIIDED